jgi:hypothetical protein
MDALRACKRLSYAIPHSYHCRDAKISVRINNHPRLNPKPESVLSSNVVWPFKVKYSGLPITSAGHHSTAPRQAACPGTRHSQVPSSPGRRFLLRHARMSKRSMRTSTNRPSQLPSSTRQLPKVPYGSESPRLKRRPQRLFQSTKARPAGLCGALPLVASLWEPAALPQLRMPLPRRQRARCKLPK